MKKIIGLLFILMMVFAFTVPVSAGNGPVNGTAAGQGPRGSFTVTGQVVAIQANVVTITALRGNTLVKPYLGTQLRLTLRTSTQFMYKNGNMTRTMTRSQLKVGQYVYISGNVANNTWTVARMTRGNSLGALP